MILVCTPDISHKERLTIILRFVQCDDKNDAKANVAFWNYSRDNDSNAEGLLNNFLKPSKELEFNVSDCGGNA